MINRRRAHVAGLSGVIGYGVLLIAVEPVAGLGAQLPPAAAPYGREQHNIYYADSTPNISGFWRPENPPGQIVWYVDGKALGRDSEGMWSGIPYTPAWLPIYLQRQLATRTGKPYGDPHFNCWPRGPVSEYLSGDGTMAITQTPGRVEQVFQEDTQVLDYYTDGRPIPREADPADPNYTPRMNGYSIGHWEGSTLVTETRGIRKELTLGFTAPHSDVTDVVTRLTPLGAEELSVDIIVTDKKALAKPLQTHLRYRRDPKGAFVDEFCAENNRNYTDKDGYLTTETEDRRPTTFDLPDN
jgi:hypothetical protein